MKTEQITKLMQHISPRYTEEAAERAASAKPKPSLMPMFGVLAGMTLCAAVVGSMIYIGNQQKLRENSFAGTAESSAEPQAIAVQTDVTAPAEEQNVQYPENIPVVQIDFISGTFGTIGLKDDFWRVYDSRGDYAAIINSADELKAYIEPWFAEESVQQYLKQYDSAFFADKYLIVNLVYQPAIASESALSVTSVNVDSALDTVFVQVNLDPLKMVDEAVAVDFVQIAVEKKCPVRHMQWVTTTKTPEEALAKAEVTEQTAETNAIYTGSTTAQTTAAVLDPRTDIFAQLQKLDYTPGTCDCLPEYQLTAPDGTVYLLNFSEKWVRVMGTDAEAKLPDTLIAWLNANSSQVSLSVCEWNHSTFDQPQIDWFCDGNYLREGIFSDVRGAKHDAIITSADELRAYLTPLYQDDVVGKYLSEYDSSFFAEHSLLVNTVYQGSGMRPMLSVQGTSYNPDTQTFNVNLDWMYDKGAVYESVMSVDFVRIAVPKEDPVTHAVWGFVDG